MALGWRRRRRRRWRHPPSPLTLHCVPINFNSLKFYEIINAILIWCHFVAMVTRFHSAGEWIRKKKINSKLLVDYCIRNSLLIHKLICFFFNYYFKRGINETKGFFCALGELHSIVSCTPLRLTSREKSRLFHYYNHCITMFYACVIRRKPDLRTWTFNCFLLSTNEISLEFISKSMIDDRPNSIATALKLPWNCSETALKLLRKLFWNWSETALKLFWKYSETFLKLLWNCSETALKLL